MEDFTTRFFEYSRERMKMCKATWAVHMNKLVDPSLVSISTFLSLGVF